MPTTFTIYAEAITSSLCCFVVSQGIWNEGTLGSDNREAWLSAISHDVTEFGISGKISEGTKSHQMNVKMKWKWIIVAGQTLISTLLTNIFNTIIKFNTYYNPWCKFITIVLRKPVKPSYETPKAYQPIALISTTAKLLMAIVVENLSKITENYQLLPSNHFGSRPGCSTSDAIHYLTHNIHKAWSANKVVSVLFLDVEGAFPNTVTNWLIHNLKRRGIPRATVKFIQQLLSKRSTRLKFDDYTSDPIPVLNGISQGDPLSVRGHYVGIHICLLTPSRPLTSIGMRTVISSLTNVS